MVPVLVKDNYVRGGTKTTARRHSGQWANTLTMENINQVGTYQLQYLITNLMLYTGSSSESFQKKLYREKCTISFLKNLCPSVPSPPCLSSDSLATVTYLVFAEPMKQAPFYANYHNGIYKKNSRPWLVLHTPICHVIGVRSRGCPITDIRFELLVIGRMPTIRYLRGFHVNNVCFNGFPQCFLQFLELR